MNASEARAVPEPDEIELRWVVGVIRQRIRLIAAFLVAALIITLAFILVQPPVYTATTTLFVEPVQVSANYDYNQLVTGERLAITYSQMLKSKPVLEEIRNVLGTNETVDELDERLTVTAVQDTQLIRLTARGESSEDAQLYADTAAGVFIDYIQSLETSRYQNSQVALKGRIDSLSAAIQTTQVQYDDLTKTRIQQESELVRLQNMLAGYRSDYQALQTDVQALQAQIDQLSGSVYVVQPAVASASEAGGAELTLLVGQTPDAQSANYASDIASDRTAQTYKRMLTARPVLEEALTQLGLSEDPEVLAGQINVEPVAGTQLLQVIVTDIPGEKAAQLANAIVDVFAEQHFAMLAEPYTRRLAAMQQQMDEISAQIDTTQADIQTATGLRVQAEVDLAQINTLLDADRSSLRALQQEYESLSIDATTPANTVMITEPAIVYTNPTQGRLPFLLLGAIAGLLGGIGAAFLVEQLNDKIRTQQDVRQTLGVSPIGSISQITEPAHSEIFVNAASAVQTEEFWLLSTSIRLATLDQPMKSLLVTSPTSAEGKSLVAANLAATFARSGEQVIVIDADLHFPRLHKIFNLEQERGLTNLLLDEDIEAHLQPTGVDGLRVLTSGTLPGEVVDIFSLPRLKSVIERIAQLADVIVIDSPPVLAVADTSILASFMDGALLVVRSGKSGRDATRNAIERLRKTHTKLLGVVLNGAPPQPDDDYHGSRAVRRTSWVDRLIKREPVKGAASAHAKEG